MDQATSTVLYQGRLWKLDGTDQENQPRVAIKEDHVADDTIRIGNAKWKNTYTVDIQPRVTLPEDPMPAVQP